MVDRAIYNAMQQESVNSERRGLARSVVMVGVWGG